MIRRECPKCSFELTVIPDHISRKCNRCFWIGSHIEDIRLHFADEIADEIADEQDNQDRAIFLTNSI